MSNILELKNINKTYKGKTENLHILKDLNLEVEEGDFISILGKSGSGKSTLLGIIGLLDNFDSGEIYINNNKIDKFESNNIDRLKNKDLGFVFQFHYLLPEFTALENVMIPCLVQNFSDKKNIENKAKDLLKKVGLEERYNHKPSELSGGEKQRVAIARALVNNPKIILADEPTGNLDEETSEDIHNLLKKINKENNQTIIVVTHSKELANITNKQYFVKQGKLILEK
ncbi:MAG: ABC transporter ATP-binding protein [Fusobacterium sp. JB021]|nr:ABC transporter ATP-binding protein [Fusobacterium sp. JB020]MDP0494444.1 ABC transporter ATP-binding protein [Fusobacterium sp. JB021]MDP0506797.1 ABC transporter ATP-binding protein [Fusobacterium sp. JB019]